MNKHYNVQKTFLYSFIQFYTVLYSFIQTLLHKKAAKFQNLHISNQNLLKTKVF
jgi:hypothetical protein